MVNAVKVFEMENDVTVAVAINAIHPNVPEKPKVIRAEVIASGMMFRSDEKDPNSTVFTFISHVDMKGMLPGFIIKNALIGEADKMRVDMTKYYNEVYLKEKEKQ